jgi:hypothetical protein
MKYFVFESENKLYSTAPSRTDPLWEIGNKFKIAKNKFENPSKSKILLVEG